MPSKEEIEKAKENITKYLNDIWFGTLYSQEENDRDEKILLEYIDQLESDKQKLIEKLEKKIRYYEENDEILATSNDNYSDGTVIKKFIDEFREILSILKGENYEH